jgi:hypothetical protein
LPSSGFPVSFGGFIEEVHVLDQFILASVVDEKLLSSLIGGVCVTNEAHLDRVVRVHMLTQLV